MNQQVHFHKHAESHNTILHQHVISYHIIYYHSAHPYRITKSVWIRKWSIMYIKVTKIFA